ncbi:MAG TPA: flagellar export protein FliJ [Candidatus Wallbacteria bacterium]|nr:MAG: Flagellar FliJ protein [bacterium ADurb.Bin243]HOD42542.1 flagellar export protein FliJ [Candidatus Wallbacteria bacterium]HPG58533.1 flagellar export protein FliJ [Candidatus Wallbacteria bacterium]
MKKFSFKLDSLLNVRKKREELVIQELAEAQMTENRINGQINDTRNTIALMIEESKSYLKSSINVESLLLSRNYIEFLKRKLSELEAELEKAKQKTLKIKEKLAEAVKERKIIETLKEKQFAQYKKEYNKQDNAQMDEISNNKQPDKD